MQRAAAAPEVDIVGLEIRRPMVEMLNERITARGLGNAAAVCCNANVSLRTFFDAGSLCRAYVHFPDPWFKKRHHKRRVVKPPLLADLRALIALGGELHFATDYAAYAEEVLELMQATAGFGPAVSVASPFGHATDREAWHSGRGDAVYRYRFERIEELGEG
jgi:tRNA (guanine-N7-)-methyltransferase